MQRPSPPAPSESQRLRKQPRVIGPAALGGRVLTIKVDAHTPLPPQRVLESARDFSDRRAHVWPNVRKRHLKVHESGPSVIVSGWGLGMCASSCECHRNPEDGQLALAEDQAGGRLGLRSFTVTAECDCCEAWTSAELAAILRDVAAVEALDSAEPAAG